MKLTEGVRIGFIIIGPPIIGGAEIRYANVFNYLNSQSDNYFLLINETRYKLLNDVKIFSSDKNIKKIRISSDKQVIDYSKEIPRISKNRNKINIIKKIFSIIKSHFIFINIFLNIKKWRRRNKIKIIFGIFQGAFYIIPYYYLKWVKTIISYNDSQFNLLNNKGVNWFAGYNIPLKRATQLDLLSEFILDGIKKHGYKIDENRINISPCSFIDYKKYYPVFPKENWVVFLGRLFHYKNPDYFLNAAIKVLEIRKDFRFFILGKGEMQNDLISKIKETGLENFVQLYYESNPVEILSKSKIFVTLQETNNYPSQSLLEAIACENAVIATDVGETRKIISETTGLLINKNVDELKNSILILMENDKLRSELARKARAKIMKEHNVSIYADYLQSIFKKILS